MLSKQYFLNKWFRISDSISKQQQELFTKNQIRPLDLNALPTNDLAKWQELKTKSDRVTKNICAIVKQ